MQPRAPGFPAMEAYKRKDLAFLQLDPRSLHPSWGHETQSQPRSAFEPPTPPTPISPAVRNSMQRRLGKALSRVFLVQHGQDHHTVPRTSIPKPATSRASTLGKFWDASSQLLTVSVRLSPEMDLFFTAPDACGGRTDKVKRLAEWKLRTNKEGKLKPVGSKAEVSTLFWEASFNPHEMVKSFRPKSAGARVEKPLPPTPERVISPEDIWTWKVENSNSVMVPVETSTVYLQRTLLCLGLDIDATESFLQFLLPSFQKYAYVALRFVPQAMYTAIAPLNITPPPEVLTRILLLYKGFKADALEPSQWLTAQWRAYEEVEFWKEIVGIDAEDPAEVELDKSRVLEWGAMEMR